MDVIKRMCDERNWKLIEDISEVVGISFNDDSKRLLGTVGDFATASLYANKIVHAADGGFVIAKQDDGTIERRLKSLVNHGFTENFHFVHFENAINAKINGLGAALACGTIPKVAEAIQHHASIASTYRFGLDRVENVTNQLKTMPKCGFYDSPWVFGVECNSKVKRRQLRRFLADHGIETRDYFFPLHLQPAFKNSDKLRLNVVEELASTGVYLPNHSNMTEQDASYIADLIDHFFTQTPYVYDSEIKIMPALLTDSMTCKVQPAQIKFRRNFHEEDVQFSLSKIFSRFHKYLKSECWSDRNYILTKIAKIRQTSIHSINSALVEEMDNISAYLNCQTHEWLPVDIPNPWLQVDVVHAEQFSKSNIIPTTLDLEIRQLLSWAVQQYKPTNVLEIGCLFGYSVQLIFESSNYVEHVTAIDSFSKFIWMKTLFPDIDMTNKDLLSTVEANISKECLEKTKLIKATLGEELLTPSDQEWMDKQKFDFVFLDFSELSDDLEQAWKVIENCLIPEKTIIFMNGVKRRAIKFLTGKSNVLKPIAKPHIPAKLYLYSTATITKAAENTNVITGEALDNRTSDDESEDGENYGLLPRCLDMSYDPEWNHHHQNAFTTAIDQVKALLHHDDAQVKFIAATEQFICDADEVLQTPWVGMVHNTVNLPDMFYVPDLERLCTPKYAPWFKSCKGLFTLTTVQREYLEEYLLPTLEVSFPILTLKYPFIHPKSFNGPSPFIDETYIPSMTKIDVVMVGAFQRDFHYFYKVEIPRFCQKALLIGEDDVKKETKNCDDNNIKVLPRANSEDYESLLRNSIVFLSLKQEGAANTLILEAIARNIPIVVPNLRSITEYIGENYPLLYNPGQSSLVELIQPKKLKAAVDYLTTKMDKSDLTVDHFVESFVNSTIVRYVPAFVINKDFDVTVSIISYRRTHHLEKILDSLWNKQTFVGRIQIIVWNNNMDRAATLDGYCKEYLRRNNYHRNLELIQSTGNHFASIRFSLPPLVKSERILICDDDIIPGPGFIQFFMENHSRHPDDILCVRGHYFKSHELPKANPEFTWKYYKHVRFADDCAPERLIHFVHSDVCLMPRKSLMEVASEPMPDKDFDLVDDYWTSFIANSKYGRNLRKLSTKNHNNLFLRTDDSDTKGIAMHKRADVFDARIRNYIHHMLQKWPKVIDTEMSLMSISEQVRVVKENNLKEFLEGRHVGFNVSSKLSIEDVNLLKSWNVKYVRIGAVCSSGRQVDFEFSNLNPMNEDSERYLNDMLAKVECFGVVITLDGRVASPELWMFIANICNKRANVIAYDLINEPYTKADKNAHFLQVSDEGIDEVLERYKTIIHHIRQVDDATAIVVEPTFFGQAYSLEFMAANNFLKTVDPMNKLVMSVHFYEPSALTTLRQDMEFPGDIVIYPYNKTNSKSTFWDETKVKERIEYLRNWSATHAIPMFIGESGIGRKVVGAEKYLQAVLRCCHDNEISCLLYAFRDEDWEGMDYEYGLQKMSGELRRNAENPLMKLVKSFIPSQEQRKGKNLARVTDTAVER